MEQETGPTTGLAPSQPERRDLVRVRVRVRVCVCVCVCVCLSVFISSIQPFSSTLCKCCIQMLYSLIETLVRLTGLCSFVTLRCKQASYMLSCGFYDTSACRIHVMGFASLCS